MSNAAPASRVSALKKLARAIGIKPKRLRNQGRLPADFDEQTRRVLDRVGQFTMTSPERIEALVNAARYVVNNGIEGDFVECGVWRGGSSMAAAIVFDELGATERQLYLYDTFEGMSTPTEEDVSIDGDDANLKFAERRRSSDSSDWCRSELDEVKDNLYRTGYPPERMHFVKGKVETTIPSQAPAGPIAILRLDTDWYASTRHELEHLYPSLVSGGVLIIDDYGHWGGARKAVDEYIAAQGLCLLLTRVDYTARIAVKP
jgi:hypothetical protein